MEWNTNLSQIFEANITAQKMKFCFKEFMCKCDQNRQFPTVLVIFIEKSLMENYNFCPVKS